MHTRIHTCTHTRILSPPPIHARTHYSPKHARAIFNHAHAHTHTLHARSIRTRRTRNIRHMQHAYITYLRACIDTHTTHMQHAYTHTTRHTYTTHARAHIRTQDAHIHTVLLTFKNICVYRPITYKREHLYLRDIVDTQIL